MLTTKRAAPAETVCGHQQAQATTILDQVYHDLSRAFQNGNLTYASALWHIVNQYGANGADAHEVILNWVTDHAIQCETRRKRRRMS